MNSLTTIPQSIALIITPREHTPNKGGLNEVEKYSHGMDWLKIAYDRVWQTWIIECQKMFKIINFIIKTWKTGKWKLRAGEQTLVQVKIFWAILQGDSLSPLLFVIAMMPFNYQHFSHHHKLVIFYWSLSDTTSLLRSPGLFSVFRSIFIMLLSRWSPFGLLFPSLSLLLPILWKLFQVHLLQLVSPSPSCSIDFFLFSSKV